MIARALCILGAPTQLQILESGARWVVRVSAAGRCKNSLGLVTWMLEPWYEPEEVMRLGPWSSPRGLQVLQTAICATPTHPTCIKMLLSGSMDALFAAMLEAAGQTCKASRHSNATKKIAGAGRTVCRAVSVCASKHQLRQALTTETYTAFMTLMPTET